MGDGAQRRHIEGAMVGGSVLAHQSAAVQTEHHGQREQSEVVNDIVVSALGKRAVDIAEGLETVFGHTSREGNGVALGYAHVEGAVGHGVHQYVHRAAGGHGGCHAHDAVVHLCQFEQGLAKHVLVLGRLVGRVAHDALAGLGIKSARSVPDGGFVFGGLVAFALGGMQVQQLGALHVFELTQQAHHLLDVVTVEGTEVAYVHALKDILLMAQHRLDGVVESYDALAAAVAQMAVVLEPSGHLEPYLVIGGIGVEIEQILLHATHSAVYAHVVVVEDDEQVVGGRRDIVETLKGQTATHGTIADDGHHMTVVVPGLAGSHRHTEGGRDGVGGMTAGEGVVLALQWGGKRADAMQMTVGAERVATSCKYLVTISLMTYIPHDAVVGGIEDIVQGNGNLDDAQTRGKVTGIDRHLVDNVLAQLAANLCQLVYIQLAQVRRVFYLA